MKDKKLKDAKVKVAVTACAFFGDDNPSDRENGEGMVFTNCNKDHLEIPMLHAALSTSAAPTYFPPHEFNYKGNMRKFVDGGLAFNNPSLIA